MALMTYPLWELRNALPMYIHAEMCKGSPLWVARFYVYYSGVSPNKHAAIGRQFADQAYAWARGYLGLGDWACLVGRRQQLKPSMSLGHFGEIETALLIKRGYTCRTKKTRLRLAIRRVLRRLWISKPFS